MKTGRNFTSGGHSTVLGAVPGLPALRRQTKLGAAKGRGNGRKDALHTPFARATHKGMKGR